MSVRERLRPGVPGPRGGYNVIPPWILTTQFRASLSRRSRSASSTTAHDESRGSSRRLRSLHASYDVDRFARAAGRWAIVAGSIDARVTTGELRSLIVL